MDRCAFLLACLPFGGITGPFLYRGGLVAIDLACAVLILAVVDGRWSGRWLFELKPLVAVGIVSYGFYLWYFPVYYGVRHFNTHWPYVWRVVVAMVMTLCVTMLSWFFIERPMMRWKDRLKTKRRIAAGRMAPQPSMGPSGGGDSTDVEPGPAPV